MHSYSHIKMVSPIATTKKTTDLKLLSFHFRILVKEEQTESKANRRKKILKDICK